MSHTNKRYRSEEISPLAQGALGEEEKTGSCGKNFQAADPLYFHFWNCLENIFISGILEKSFWNYLEHSQPSLK